MNTPKVMKPKLKKLRDAHFRVADTELSTVAAMIAPCSLKA
ncbi:MAG: hypothetical protein ABR920_19395 [Terriglobales bacterium]